MNEYDNNLRGVLFKNDKEGGNENWPDYKGSCEINGQQFWLSAWIKTGKKGKFMSLAFKPKMAAEHKGGANNPPAKQEDFDDQIPF